MRELPARWAHHQRARAQRVCRFLASVGRDARGRGNTAASRDNPGDLKAALGASLLLPAVYRGLDDLEQWRADYVAGLANIEAARERFRFPTPREAMLQARWTNFYLAYQGRDDRELQARFGDFMLEVLRPAMPDFFAPRVPIAGRSRIRVGFCSHFFFNCTVGRYFASWITRLDRNRFEIVSTPTSGSPTTHAPSPRPPTNSATSGTLVRRGRAGVRREISLVCGLGMHGETFSLASLRLAPVRVAGWGHPTTTGLPNIDYFVSSREMGQSAAASIASAWCCYRASARVTECRPCLLKPRERFRAARRRRSTSCRNRSSRSIRRTTRSSPR